MNICRDTDGGVATNYLIMRVNHMLDSPYLEVYIDCTFQFSPVHNNKLRLDVGPKLVGFSTHSPITKTPSGEHIEKIAAEGLCRRRLLAAILHI